MSTNEQYILQSLLALLFVARGYARPGTELYRALQSALCQVQRALDTERCKHAA